MVEDVWARFLEGDRIHLDTKHFLVPFTSEVIAVINQAIAIVDVNSLSNCQVLRLIVLFSAERHAWIVGEKWLLSELLSLKEHGEWDLSIICLIDFLDFHRLIRQEEVQDVVFIASIVRVVLPQDVERQHASIILQETIQVFVGSATLKHNFDIVLVLSKIGRVLLHGDHCACLHKWIIRILLRCIQCNALISVVSLREIISIYYSKYSAIDIQVDSDVKVFPIVCLWLLSRDKCLVSLKKDALRNTAVLYAVLKDVQSVIVQVVVHCALPHTVVLIWVLHYWLLKVCTESQNLTFAIYIYIF